MKSLFVTVILTYLRFLTALQLMKVRPVIIGVTGSAGKSSTVQAISATLQNDFTIKVGEKGNSQTGIPFEILSIPVKDYQGFQWLTVCLLALKNVLLNWKKYDVLVLEMGIDSDKAPNNMEYLLSIVQPHIGVLLNVNSVHSANYSASADPLLAIANEKGKLLTRLPKSGIAILSPDQPQTAQLIPHIEAKTLTFSTDNNSDATIVLKKHTVSLTGTRFTFLHNSEEYELFLPSQLQFSSAFGGFASAVLIADQLGVSIDQAIASLTQHFQPPAGRMTILPGHEHSTIIDSSYNSSPGATFPALEMLRSIPGKKGLVLGDMRELGESAGREHQRLAEYAAKVADWIVLVGPLTRQYTLPTLKKIKFPEKNVVSVITAYEAIPEVQKRLLPKQILFVKGSQNTILLEIVVEAFMAHPEQAKKLLCRQTPYWDKQREKLQTLSTQQK